MMLRARGKRRLGQIQRALNFEICVWSGLGTIATSALTVPLWFPLTADLSAPPRVESLGPGCSRDQVDNCIDASLRRRAAGIETPIPTCKWRNWTIRTMLLRNGGERRH